jgi:MFS transporter, PPP family, 3-phenylpropionic acid transporter
MLAQLLWGTIADRSKNKTFILNVLISISACLFWLIPLAGSSFYLILIIIAVFQFFGNAVVPIGDSITLELAKNEGFKFSTVRFVGSFGFAVMATVAGKILMLDIRYVFDLFCVLSFFSWLVSFRIPTVMGHPKFKGEKDSFFDLFKDKKLMVIYLYLFLISISTGFFTLSM